MKLNWFSPLPPARTDIAHYTGRILCALADHADVTLWTDQEHWDPRLAWRARVRRYDPGHILCDELQEADETVYNLGNNDRFHGGIWRASVEHPGVVVLHDLHLHHFFAGLFCGHWCAASHYRTVMRRFYGDRGWRDAYRFCRGLVPIDEMAARYPLSGLAVQNALGVVVHSRAALESVRRLVPVPVVHLPLPYKATHPHTRGRHTGSAPCRLIVFGHLGANRRVDRLLEALGTLPERDRFRLSIYGEVCDEVQVRALIDRFDLHGLVRLHGYVPEEELEAALDAADLAVNLRDPTWGEASGSQLRIWDHARTALVTRLGWYADLPEDSVDFVRPECEIADIQRALRCFLADPERYRRIGRNGRRILETRHDPRAYSRELVDFVKDVKRVREHASATATRGAISMGRVDRSSDRDAVPFEVQQLTARRGAVSRSRFEAAPSHAAPSGLESLSSAPGGEAESRKALRVAFVVQRYGAEVGGGAEHLCRQVAERMQQHWDVEVLTTCAMDYLTWKDFYTPGTSELGGVNVRRFRVDHPRCPALFEQLAQAVYSEKTSLELQQRWLVEQGPVCSELLRYLDSHTDRYDLFFFFTWLYWPTFYGLSKVARKSVLIPTAHDEPAFHLGIFERLFRQPRALVFNSPEERDLVLKKFGTSMSHDVVGVGIDDPGPVDPQSFRQQYRGRLTGPFLLYLGRMDSAKGCPEMFEFFLRYKREHPNLDLQLALAGKKAMPVPDHPDLVHLGFISDREKMNALAAAELLVMPSPYESLSLVTLEAWSVGTAVLANGRCAVLKGQVERSGGGLPYTNYSSFRQALDKFLGDAAFRRTMGEHGRAYVQRQYRWPAIEAAYVKWGERVARGAKAPLGNDAVGSMQREARG